MPKLEQQDHQSIAHYEDFKQRIFSDYKRPPTLEKIRRSFPIINRTHLENDHCRTRALMKLLPYMNRRFIKIYLRTTKEFCVCDCKRNSSHKYRVKKSSRTSMDSGLPASRDASKRESNGSPRQDNKVPLSYQCEQKSDLKLVIRATRVVSKEFRTPKARMPKFNNVTIMGLNEEFPKLRTQKFYGPDQLDETERNVKNAIEYPDSVKVLNDRVGKLVAPVLTPGPKILSDTISTIMLGDSLMPCEEKDCSTSSTKAEMTLMNSPHWDFPASTLRKVSKSLSSIASESSSMLCEEYGSLLVRTLEKNHPTTSKNAGTTMMDSAQVKDIMKDFGDKLLGQFMDLCNKRLEQPEPSSCKTCATKEVSRESQACQTDIRSNVPIKLEFHKMEPISFQSTRYMAQDEFIARDFIRKYQRTELCMAAKVKQAKAEEREVPQIDNEKLDSPHVNEYDSYDLSAEESTNSLLEVTKSLLEQSTSSEDIPAIEKTPCRFCGTPFKTAEKRRNHYVKEHIKDIFGEGSQQCHSPEFEDGNCTSESESFGFEYDEGTYDNFGSNNSGGTEEISTQSAEYSLESDGIEIHGTPESRVTPKPKSRQEVRLELTNEENSSSGSVKTSGPLCHCENGQYNYPKHANKTSFALDTSELVRETSFMDGLARQKSCSVKESTRIDSGSEQSFLDQSVNLEEPLRKYMSQEFEEDKENREKSMSPYGTDEFRENLRALAPQYRPKNILSPNNGNCTEGASQSNIPNSVNSEEESPKSKYDASKGQTSQLSFDGPIPRIRTSAIAGRSGIQDADNKYLYSFCAPITYSSEEFSDDTQ
ncbi:hypothetical protein Ddc_11383 [Ditylenchus destructor]|nr:hypothetical protein Ddc_11383 [Ditylenchus destructor]